MEVALVIVGILLTFGLFFMLACIADLLVDSKKELTKIRKRLKGGSHDTDHY